jgi:hypothetical protein
MSKIQSLANRANMDNYDVLFPMIKEIPDQLISKKGNLGYFGTPAIPALVHSRRKYMNIKHNNINTVITENDNFFIEYGNMIAPEAFNKINATVVDYQTHINKGLDKSVKWSVSNKPYNYPGKGAARLWADLVKADNLNGVLDWQANLLPVSLQRGQDGELIEMRDLFFNQYGLKKIKTLPFDAFKEYNADVDTSIYICEKGYTGPLNIVTDVSSFNYNFKDRGIIVTPDTVDEVDFIFNCLDSTSYNFKQSRLTRNGERIRLNNEKNLVSKTKTPIFKYPLITRLGKDKLELSYTSEIIDDSINFDRLVIPYQTSGYDNGCRELGVARHVPAGTQLGGSYLYETSLKNIKEIEAHATYLKSLPVEYLLYNWRTSPTNDAPQLNVIPRLKDLNAQSVEDYIKDMGGEDLKDLIINGYRKKTKKK